MRALFGADIGTRLLAARRSGCLTVAAIKLIAALGLALAKELRPRYAPRDVILRQFSIGTLSLSLALTFVSASEARLWPNETDRVEAGLRSEDVTQRRAAAEQLLKLSKTSAERLVPLALADDDTEVRVSAAGAATHFKLRDSSALAIGWLSERDARLRVAATELLGRAEVTTETLGALARALSDTDVEVRFSAVVALGSSRDPRAAMSLLGHVDETNLKVQLAVIEALRELGDERAVVPLVGKIQDSRAQVREAVARALSSFEGERVGTALVLLLRDGDERVRVAAVDALGRSADVDAIDALSHVLRTDESLDVRVAAVDALAATKTERAATALIGLLDDPRNEISTEARLALARIGPAAVESLLQCLNGQPSVVRADACVYALARSSHDDAPAAIGAAWRRRAASAEAALQALAVIGSSQSLPIVLESLGDSDPWVRSHAMDALEQLLDPDKPEGRAVEPLIQAAQAAVHRPEELLTVTSLLGRTGSLRVAPLLATFAQSSRLRLRIAAIRSLGWVRATAHQQLLLDALSSSEPRVRQEAAFALRRAGDVSAVGDLFNRLDRSSDREAPWLALALSGPLNGSQDSALVTQLDARIRKGTGPMRDALLEALAHMDASIGGPALVRLGRDLGPRTRAKVAELLARFPAQKASLSSMLQDGAATRANAVWSLGFVAGEGDLEALVKATKDTDPRVAANATVGIGRLASRSKEPLDVKGTLCPLTASQHAAVRASAFVAVRLAGADCEQAAIDALRDDASPLVRVAAAQTLTNAKSESARSALQRCFADERDPRVATACTEPAPRTRPRDEAVTVFVFAADGTEPLLDGAYALRFADGTIRHGSADRRGAVCEVSAPEGALRLEVPLLDDATYP